VVDALLSGVHEPGDSHHDLMRAFAGVHVLGRMTRAVERGHYRTHEFGDSVLLERQRIRCRPRTVRRAGRATCGWVVRADALRLQDTVRGARLNFCRSRLCELQGAECRRRTESPAESQDQRDDGRRRPEVARYRF
jgi:hypothetical protein